MRWSSTANSDDKQSLRRERFSTTTVVLGTFSAFILLLALLFPKERLTDILGRSHAGDPATIRYLEAMLRVHPENSPLRMRLAGLFVESGAPRKALEVLDGFRKGLSAIDQRKMLELRYRALKEILATTGQRNVEWRRYQAAFSATVRELAKESTKVPELRAYAADARETGDLETWRDLSRRADALSPPPPAPHEGTVAGDPYTLALAKGDYRAAAAICFNGMKQASSLGQRRQLFIKGVRTLQSGNLPVEALDAGERHLDGLSGDRETILFLTRIGLAAGKPERAQQIIKRALKMGETRISSGQS